MTKQKVIVIVGSTSSGKSALAVELARKFNGEVISADSRQVYRGLNIGAGKITKREMRGVRHHLLGIANPKKIFTAHDFTIHAHRAIEDIARRGKLPIICGGTGFYVDALVGRIPLADAAINRALRARLEKKTVPALFALLEKKDRTRAATIDRHNKRRLIRALEIVHTSRSSHQGDTSTASRCHLDGILWLGIRTDQKVLGGRIRARLRARMRHGMIAEVRRLHDAGLSWKRMDELGLEYRYISRYLKNEIGRADMMSQLETKIWQYARRQRTYWRRNSDIHWLPSADLKQAISIVNKSFNV